MLRTAEDVDRDLDEHPDTATTYSIELPDHVRFDCYRVEDRIQVHLWRAVE